MQIVTSVPPTLGKRSAGPDGVGTLVTLSQKGLGANASAGTIRSPVNSKVANLLNLHLLYFFRSLATSYKYTEVHHSFAVEYCTPRRVYHFLQCT